MREGGSSAARKVPTACAVLAVMFLAAPLGAETLLAGSAGAAFGGITDDSKLTYAATLTFKGRDSLLGFAIDFGYTEDFLGTAAFGDSNLASLQGNLVVMGSGSLRPYASAGLGLVKTRVEDVAGFFEVDSNELGFNVGGGLVGFPGEGWFGLQADLRYFRNLTDPEPDGEFDVDLGGLDFWRATGGIVLRF